MYISKTSSAYPKKKYEDFKKSRDVGLSALGLGLALPRFGMRDLGSGFRVECFDRKDFKHCGASRMMTLQDIGASVQILMIPGVLRKTPCQLEELQEVTLT